MRFHDDKALLSKPAARAASLITGAMAFRRLLPEDVTRTSDPNTNNHIAVIRRNQFFTLDLKHSDGSQLSTAEIESQLQKIYDAAGSEDGVPLGILTTEDRDTWTKVREQLIAANPINKTSLDAIETAAFVVCLDSSKPITIDEVFQAVKICLSCRLAKNEIDHGSTQIRKDLPSPKKLEFKLGNDLLAAISRAEAKFDELVGKHDLTAVVWDGYGKNLIKKFQVSPDAFAQMAIQLAYFKTYGKCVATYESAQTRKAKDKGILGRKAIAAQSQYMARAVEGKGVDRHLLGLRLTLKPEEPKPEIFTDPSYSRTCHWQLSTSQITSEYYNGYGWGEVVPDGYGVAYMVKENALQFNLVSLKLRNDVLKHYFFEALREMRTVFEASLPPPKAKL
ncbi:Carnitine O-acetyltransferase mitochondrial [Phlyctochytrium bullatum]|nr:Carnitine O-acetyltransferase mitochondrial [Phlyctochytrium bullatum]